MLDSAGSRAGVLAALTASLFFGINTVAAKISADAGAAGPAIVFYRTVAMIALILAAAVALRLSLRIARPAWPAMAVMMATSAGMGICYMSSVSFIPVTVAAVIFYTYPIAIVLAAPFVERRALERRELVVAFVAFAGIVLVVGPSFHALDPRGLALALLASAFTAAQFFAANRIASEPVSAKLFWVQLGVLPIAAALAFIAGGLAPARDFAGAPGAIGVTIACYVVGSIGMIMALSRLTAAIAGLIFCLEPVVSAIASAVWLDERLTMVQYLGGALVIAAVAATAMAPARQPKFA